MTTATGACASCGAEPAGHTRNAPPSPIRAGAPPSPIRADAGPIPSVPDPTSVPEPTASIPDPQDRFDRLLAHPDYVAAKGAGAARRGAWGLVSALLLTIAFLGAAGAAVFVAGATFLLLPAALIALAFGWAVASSALRAIQGGGGPAPYAAIVVSRTAGPAGGVVTLEFPTGSRREFAADVAILAAVADGDAGIASIDGTRMTAFRRVGV